MSGERRRLPLALLLSLMMHALLLSLTFSGDQLGLPGLSFPWQARRAEVPTLQVMLVPARVTPVESVDVSPALVKQRLQQVLIEQTVDGGLALTPSASMTTSAIAVQASGLTAVGISPKTMVTAKAEPTPDVATSAVPIAVPSKSPSRTEVSSEVAPTPIPEPIPAPAVIAVERSAHPTFVVPPPPLAPAPALAPVIEVAPGDETARQEAAQLAAAKLEAQRQETARQEAARLEAARLEIQRQANARLEADRLDAARLAVAKQEAQRQDAARQEAARIEAARLDAARLDAARLDAARQEAERKAVARQEAARTEAARLDAARLEAARQETARQEAVRQAAAQKEAARVQGEKEEDARRAARREAMGRVLNEEADRRDSATKAAEAAAGSSTSSKSQSTLPYSLSTARRGRLWGRSDANVELVQYAEAWARKIQFNTSVDTVREMAKRPHTNPMVTVAIRSDGSVESVTFVLSSGVAEVDESIRRIIQSQAPYQSFSPGLAIEYDVVEVRRTWHFDTGIRLY